MKSSKVKNALRSVHGISEKDFPKALESFGDVNCERRLLSVAPVQSSSPSTSSSSTTSRTTTTRTEVRVRHAALHAVCATEDRNHSGVDAAAKGVYRCQVCRSAIPRVSATITVNMKNAPNTTRRASSTIAHLVPVHENAMFVEKSVAIALMCRGPSEFR